MPGFRRFHQPLVGTGALPERQGNPSKTCSKFTRSVRHGLKGVKGFGIIRVCVEQVRGGREDHIE